VICLPLGPIVVGIVLGKDMQRLGVLANHALPDAANPFASASNRSSSEAVTYPQPRSWRSLLVQGGHRAGWR
jgi:hypothetical protein